MQISIQPNAFSPSGHTYGRALSPRAPCQSPTLGHLPPPKVTSILASVITDELCLSLINIMSVSFNCIVKYRGNFFIFPCINIPQFMLTGTWFGPTWGGYQQYCQHIFVHISGGVRTACPQQDAVRVYSPSADRLNVHSHQKDTKSSINSNPCQRLVFLAF